MAHKILLIPWMPTILLSAPSPLSLKNRVPKNRLSSPHVLDESVKSRVSSCGDGVIEECYLVDPASSHMLVSKIKPCMCKYELIQTVKLRMAH